MTNRVISTNVMDKEVISPSKLSKTPPEKTLKLLHDRLNFAEEEAKKLSTQLSGYGFKAAVSDRGANDEHGNAIPFKAKSSDGEINEISQKNYEHLVTRVCRSESTVQSLKLALVSLEAEHSLMNRQSAAGTLRANEVYEKELTKLKRDFVNCRRQLDESERFRAETAQEFDKIRQHLNSNDASASDVVEKVIELKKAREKLSNKMEELQSELNHEKGLRISIENSQDDLLERVNEMEAIVEKENEEMKLLSGDCSQLKEQLSKTATLYEREYQTRIQLEKLVERLNTDLEEMEFKLLTISNERKSLDADLSNFKRENKEHRQQMDILRSSNEKLKAVNLDLEERLKEASCALRITMNDNKLLIAKHQDAVGKEKEVFAEKLREQDKLLDQAKASILQELSKERLICEEKNKENFQLRNDLTLLQNASRQKDIEVSNLKTVLEKLTVDRDKMVEENEKAILEIRRSLDNFVSEKTILEAEHNQTKDETKIVRIRNEQLEKECHSLRQNLLELENQQKNQNRVNTAFQNMLEDKKRLAYEKGVLQTENERMVNALTTSEDKINNVFVELEDCRRRLKNTEIEKQKFETMLIDKDNKIQSLSKNKHKAVLETERVLRKTDNHEKKYGKKIESLQKCLLQAREDNVKLAASLETVITSHSQLQSTCEKLETELGKRDSEYQFDQEERSNMQSMIEELTNKLENLQRKLVASQEEKASGVESLRKALEVVQDDRNKLLKTVEPLVNANQGLQASLEKLNDDLEAKKGEIKQLRHSSLILRQEMDRDKQLGENKVDDMRKQYEKDLKELRTKNKKETTKLRKDYQDLVSTKNKLKEEIIALKEERGSEEEQQKKWKDRIKYYKTQLDQCLQQRAQHEQEMTDAKQKIQSMSRELAKLENLKSEYTKNNVEQAKSLQEFVSQLTDLQEEFRSLSEAQHHASLLCKEKDGLISKEKLRRKELEMQYQKLKSREKKGREFREHTERKLQEANIESEQVAANLQEAHDWFKGKYSNLQSELSKSKKIQSVLQKDNVVQYRALQEEKKRADDATVKAKEIIKSSRLMISKLIGQVVEDTSDESREIQQAMIIHGLKTADG